MELESFHDAIKPIGKANQETINHLDNIITTLGVLEAFGQQSMYIVDYRTLSFLYVSPHPLLLCGYSRDEVKNWGYNFYPKVVPNEDMEMLLEINQVGFDFFYKTPPEERLHVFLSYDFRIKHRLGHTTLINHKIKPLLLAEDGNIWLSVCRVSLSHMDKPGNIRVQMLDGSADYDYSLSRKVLIPHKQKKLSDEEHQLLTLSAQGYKEAQLADILNINLERIKNIRQKIYKLLDVANMPEAVYLAQAQGLI